MKMIRIESTVCITMAGIKRMCAVIKLPHCYCLTKGGIEWVPESRILKLNEAGLEKQKSLQLETLAE